MMGVECSTVTELASHGLVYGVRYAVGNGRVRIGSSASQPSLPDLRGLCNCRSIEFATRRSAGVSAVCEGHQAS